MSLSGLEQSKLKIEMLTLETAIFKLGTNEIKCRIPNCLHVARLADGGCCICCATVYIAANYNDSTFNCDGSSVKHG